jgi:predicted RNA binding protein YcfA (HicA-like mRNA interferase family)
MSIKIRAFQKLLRELGAEPVRQTGAHQVWRLPNGHTIPLVIGRGELSRNLVKSWKQEFARVGWEWPSNA